jgi:hypothetical protein
MNVGDPTARQERRFVQWRPAFLVASALIVAVLGGWLAIRWWTEPVPLANPPPATLEPGEQDFFDFVEPRLAALAREGDELVAFAERRDRNILALNAAQGRVETLIGDLHDYANQSGVPPGFQTAWDTYVRASERVKAGIQQSREAFVRLDWTALEAATVEFAAGVDGVDRAIELIHAAAGLPPSEATPPRS